jgi:hypothetical protein
MIKDLLHDIMSLVDKNSSLIPEGDYLTLCEKVVELYKNFETQMTHGIWDPSDNDMVVTGWENEVD